MSDDRTGALDDLVGPMDHTSFAARVIARVAALSLLVALWGCSPSPAERARLKAETAQGQALIDSVKAQQDQAAQVAGPVSEAQAPAAPIAARPPADDHIEFNAADTRSSAVLNVYEQATRNCLYGRSRYLLYQGAQSKAEIVAQTSAMCGRTFADQLKARAAYTQELADAQIDVMAEQELASAMTQEGAR